MVAFKNLSSDSLVKNLGKNDFKYLSQEFDNNFCSKFEMKTMKYYHGLKCDVLLWGDVF